MSEWQTLPPSWCQGAVLCLLEETWDFTGDTLSLQINYIHHKSKLLYDGILPALHFPCHVSQYWAKWQISVPRYKCSMPHSPDPLSVTCPVLTPPLMLILQWNVPGPSFLTLLSTGSECSVVWNRPLDRELQTSIFMPLVCYVIFSQSLFIITWGAQWPITSVKCTHWEEVGTKCLMMISSNLKSL